MIPTEPPFDIAREFDAERGRLLDLLGGLTADDWALPTRCPGWTVLDLVVHLVGDDIGSLSWHRDGHRGSAPPPETDAAGFIAWLDQLQDGWVHAARRISPALAAELLGWLGDRLVELIRSADQGVVDAHVSWASDRPVPRWLDHGRDLTEYWLHRQQLLDALGRPVDRDPAIVGRVLDVLRWSLPHGLAGASAPPGSTVSIELSDPTIAWTLACGDDGWRFTDRPAGPIVASWTSTAEQAWRLLSNNLEPERHGDPLIAGEPDVVLALRRTRAIIGRWDADPTTPAR